MIDWIETNYVQVLAAVGFLYSAARIIVVLTPTPRDDAALYKLSRWLKALGKLIGLDLTQGVTGKKYAKGSMVAVISCLILAAGCSPVIQTSPRAQLYIAQNTFIGVVNSLADIREMGGFSNDEIDEITEYMDKAYQCLIMWQAGMESGTGTLKWEAAFDAVLRKLIQYQIEREIK